MTRKTFLSALLVSICLILPLQPAVAESACLSPQDIQNAVTSGKILSLNEVLARAGIPPDKVLRPVRVCDQGSGLVYQVPIDEGGQARTIVLNAMP